MTLGFEEIFAIVIVSILLIDFLMDTHSVDPETARALESMLPLNEKSDKTTIEEYNGRMVARGIIAKVSLERKERIDDINTYYIKKWYDIIFSDGKIIKGVHNMPSYLEGEINRIVYYKSSGDIISITYK